MSIGTPKILTRPEQQLRCCSVCRSPLGMEEWLVGRKVTKAGLGLRNGILLTRSFPAQVNIGDEGCLEEAKHGERPKTANSLQNDYYYSHVSLLKFCDARISDARKNLDNTTPSGVLFLTSHVHIGLVLRGCINPHVPTLRRETKPSAFL